jgi:hypothetical protein
MMTERPCVRLAGEPSLQRTSAASLAALALMLLVALGARVAWADQSPSAGDELFAASHDDRFPDGAVFYQFGWGNGQTWHLSGIDARWHVNSTSQYGLIAERYVLADPGGTVSDDRIGASAVIGDPDAIQVRVRALDSQFGDSSEQFNGSLDVLGALRHFRYEAIASLTGIDGAPSAQVDLITTAGVNERLSNLVGQLGWASKSTSAYVRGRVTNFSDGNRYSLVGFGAMQDLGIPAVDVELGGFVNESGYAFVYPLALAGYYNYQHEDERALQATVRLQLGKHFQATATGNTGVAQTSLVGGYQTQTRQQFQPALTYTNHNLALAASGSFAQYLGATYIPDFQGNRVDLSLTTRL